NRAPDGDLRPAHRAVGGFRLCAGGGAGALRLLAAAAALAAGCLLSGAPCSPGLRISRRLRCAGEARLHHAWAGAALALAVSSSGREPAVPAGARSGSAGRAAGGPAGGILVVLRCRGGAGLGILRAARQLVLAAQ